MLKQALPHLLLSAVRSWQPPMVCLCLLHQSLKSSPVAWTTQPARPPAPGAGGCLWGDVCCGLASLAARTQAHILSHDPHVWPRSPPAPPHRTRRRWRRLRRRLLRPGKPGRTHTGPHPLAWSPRV